MTADGTWDVLFQSAQGDRRASLDLRSNGTTLTGSMSGDGGAMDISDGTIDGNSLTWKAEITEPMKFAMNFTATVSGDSIAGGCEMGAFGTATFHGERASSDA